MLKESNVSKNYGGINNHVGAQEKPTLSDYSITKKQSHEFQKIASLPQKIFEEEISIAKEESNKRVELTTNCFIVLKNTWTYWRIYACGLGFLFCWINFK